MRSSELGGNDITGLGLIGDIIRLALKARAAYTALAIARMVGAIMALAHYSLASIVRSSYMDLPLVRGVNQKLVK